MKPSLSNTPGTRLRVLHLEDNARDATLIHNSLRAAGMDGEILRVETRQDFANALNEGAFDLVLSDYTLPAFDGLSALQMARQKIPQTPFIFISGTIGEERAVESLMNGAVDYVLKDRLPRLVPAIRRALREAQERAERERLQEEIRQRNQLFHQIGESVDDLIAVCDLEGRRVFTSASYVRLFGAEAGKVGADQFATIHPLDRERVRQIFYQTIGSGQPTRLKFSLQLPEGDTRQLEAQFSVIRDQKHRVTHIVSIGRDVTEEEKTALQLRQQAALLDQAQDAIFVRNLDHRITYWNKGAERVYGWTAAEVLGRQASEFLYAPDAQQGEAVQPGCETGDWVGEMTHITKESQAIIVESRRTVLHDASGDPVAILSINTDVTQKKDLEAQFRRAQRLDNIGSLAGGIAHDINNILAPVLLASGILREHVPAGPGHEILDTMEGSALRGSNLVNQILQFASGIKGEHVPLRFQNVLMEFSLSLKRSFPQTIQVQARSANELPLVMGDAAQIHQMLLNLCLHARDAMPKGGRLTLTATNVVLGQKVFPCHLQAVSGDFVMLSVADTGAGIPVAQWERTFRRFFTGKTMDPGAGLGLLAVAGIVQEHRGFMELMSDPASGTTINIYLPAARHQETPTPARRNSGAPVGQGEHILLVDDELALLEVTKEMLEAHHYVVTCARDGASALKFYQEHQDDIDIVITDLVMPGLDGPALVHAVKRLAPDAKIICVSGLTTEEKVAELRFADVRAILRKPYMARDLLVIMREVIAGGRRTDVLVSCPA